MVGFCVKNVVYCDMWCVGLVVLVYELVEVEIGGGGYCGDEIFVGYGLVVVVVEIFVYVVLEGVVVD